MKKVITIMGLFGFMIVQAQVGINTDTPQAALDIKSKGDNNTTKALKITNSANAEMVTVADDGKLGVGATAPTRKLDVRGDVLIENNSKTETIFPLLIKNSGHLSSEILNQSAIGFTDKNDKLYAFFGEGSPSGKSFGFSTRDSYTAFLGTSNVASVKEASGELYDTKNKVSVGLAIFSADSPTENLYDLAFNISRNNYGANPPSTIIKQSIIKGEQNGNISIGRAHSIKAEAKLDVRGDVLIETNSKTETIFPLLIKNSGYLSSEILNMSMIGFTDKNDKLYAFFGEGSPSGKSFGFSTRDSYTAFLGTSNVASVKEASGELYDTKNKVSVGLAIFSADSPTENVYDLAFNISRNNYGANPPSTIIKQSIIKGEQNGNISIGRAHSIKAEAKLDVNGYIKLGSADTTADVTPKAGMLRYNTNTDKFQGYVEDTNPSTTEKTPGWVDLH